MFCCYPHNKCPIFEVEYQISEICQEQNLNPWNPGNITCIELI